MSLDLSKFDLDFQIDPTVAENLSLTLIDHFKQNCEDIGIEPREVVLEILKQARYSSKLLHHLKITARPEPFT